jgi:competence protein ComGC
MMSLKRGVTLIELMVGVVMVVVLTFATADLFLFSTKRVSAQGADSAVQMQVSQLASEILKMTSQAKNCQLAFKNGNTALVCEMPATGTDQDFDGVLDHFTPDGSVGGKEIFNTGFYVWFYMSDSSGAWGTTGNQIWRAVVYSNNPPGPADVDQKWETYYGGAMKWILIDNVTFTVDPVTQTDTFTISASSLARSDRSAANDPNSPSSHFTGTWTSFWQNFRNLVVNGSFEYPSVSGNGWGYFMGDGLTGGWVASSSGPVEIQYGGFGATSPFGNQHLELDADVPGSIKQTLTTVAGKTYWLSFYYTPRPGCSNNKIEVKWNGNSVTILNGDGSGLPMSAAWTQKTYTLTATGSSTDLEFIDESASGDKEGGLLDNVVVMPK